MNLALNCLPLLLAGTLLAAPTATAASRPNPPSAESKGRKPKPVNQVRVHVENRHDLPERTLPVQVGRSDPMHFTVEKLPILNEVHIDRAALLEEGGLFRVQLRFNRIGARILESYSSAAAGRHLLIVTDIDGESRWLAAPVIRQRISDGSLAFTPDASREEMERLVRGLNEAIEKRRKRWLN
ncbi:MAG: hypothetical protein KF833_14300 [Verrucomicrobiae bacterium]|nr:hypothetical protein [Verrucomicrobiae bacterium]